MEEVNEIFRTQKKWGIIYLIFGLVTIISSVYLFYFSGDGEIYALFGFPIPIIAIFYFLYGGYLIFQKTQQIRKIEDGKEKWGNIHFGKHLLLSNIYIAFLTVITGLILASKSPNDGFGPLVMIMNCAIIFGAYVLFTFIIYLIIGFIKGMLFQKSKYLFNLVFFLSLILYFGTVQEIYHSI